MMTAHRHSLWQSVLSTLMVYALLLAAAVPQGTMIQASADGWSITICGDNGLLAGSGEAPAAQADKCVWATHHAVNSVLPTAFMAEATLRFSDAPLTMVREHQSAYATPRRANWAQGPPHLV